MQLSSIASTRHDFGIRLLLAVMIAGAVWGWGIENRHYNVNRSRSIDARNKAESALREIESLRKENSATRPEVLADTKAELVNELQSLHGRIDSIEARLREQPILDEQEKSEKAEE